MVRVGWCSGFALALVAGVAGCSGGGAPPAPGPQPQLAVQGLTTADRFFGGPCSVSVDGVIWYRVADRAMPAIDFAHAACSGTASFASVPNPPVPSWARPSGPTQALFVATSLQEAYSLAGMQRIDADAENAHVPVTWMIGNPEYLTADSAYYNQLHQSVGDDVELEESAALASQAQSALPWYAPAVSVQGAGHERDPKGVLAGGNGGFWGITWNSHGTDDTSDEGAPWGTYCADPTSYKRPDPDGTCPLVVFEWTARDLTRAYLTNTNADGYSAEAAFSTDPDDILDRAHYTEAAGAQYIRELTDAYAAAGQTQPIVMMSQQESADEGQYPGRDDPLLSALYQEAVLDGMHATTLRAALPSAQAFSAAPRAIAFPYLDGGETTAYNGVPFTPATIDYHDDLAGLTFIAGHTLPSREFLYADDPVSTYNHALAALPATDQPRLTRAAVANGTLQLTFVAPVALHTAIALWTDPSALALSGSNVTPAGHAGVVIAFDLPAGTSTQSVACGGCASTTFPFAI